MLYFTPPTSNPDTHTAIRERRLGFIKTPNQGNALIRGSIWCADNGCFGNGYPGDAAWLRWLSYLDYARADCWFATAPDIVGDGAASLIRSRPLLPKIRALGFPAALVVQEGSEHLTLPWDEFDVLFVGGETTEWKLSPAAHELVIEAQERGKYTHMGRVNTLKRMRVAKAWDVDSIDGTLLRFGPKKHLEPLLRWLRDLNGAHYHLDHQLGLTVRSR